MKPRAPRYEPRTALPDAVLFDRDGTLVHDVPYNSDPDLVRPVPGARDALDTLRARGVQVGVVSNQSGVGRGWISPAQLDAVNLRVEELLGPFTVWETCPHRPDEGCRCRKPLPGLVLAAARELGVRTRDVVVVGDIGADVEAAAAAGARSILVPTSATLPEEISAADDVAPDLMGAVTMILGNASPSRPLATAGLACGPQDVRDAREPR